MRGMENISQETSQRQASTDKLEINKQQKEGGKQTGTEQKRWCTQSMSIFLCVLLISKVDSNVTPWLKMAAAERRRQGFALTHTDAV